MLAKLLQILSSNPVIGKPIGFNFAQGLKIGAGLIGDNLFRGSLLGFLILFLPVGFAAAAEPIFNVIPELQLADTRLELAERPPRKFVNDVALSLGKVRRGWSKSAVECANPKVAEKNLVRTKAFLQGILRNIVEASNLTPRTISAYGVCAEPIEQPNGIFANMLSGPRLHEGVIQVPPKFLLEFHEEDELAFVIAHEFSHFLLKHEILFAYLEGTHRTNRELLVSSEREADELAMRLLINAGYDIDKALVRMKELRAQDETHYVGSQLQDLRNIVMTDLQKTQRRYNPVRSTPYLPPDVFNEINAYLKPQVDATLY